MVLDEVYLTRKQFLWSDGHLFFSILLIPNIVLSLHCPKSPLYLKPLITHLILHAKLLLLRYLTASQNKPLEFHRECQLNYSNITFYKAHSTLTLSVYFFMLPMVKYFLNVYSLHEFHKHSRQKQTAFFAMTEVPSLFPELIEPMDFDSSWRHDRLTSTCTRTATNVNMDFHRLLIGVIFNLVQGWTRVHKKVQFCRRLFYFRPFCFTNWSDNLPESTNLVSREI